MKTYIAKRLFLMAIVLLLVATITFAITHIAPGDPAAIWAGTHPTQQQFERAIIELGLDKPLHIRYFNYLGNLLKGDFGTSIRTRQPVIGDLISYYPATIELVALSTLISLMIGIPFGIFSAVRRESLLDQTGRILAISGVAVPIFWLGMMVQLAVTNVLQGFPIQGRISTLVAMNNPVVSITGFYLIDPLLQGNFVAFISALKHIILPSFIMSAGSLAYVMRMARSSMVDVLGLDYIRTVRAYGVSEKLINYKYALKNALLPTVTVIGLQLGFALGGSVLVESIFNWPGIGRYIWLSIGYNDYPAIMATTIIFAVTYLCINLIMDLIYALIDPRVRVAR